MNILIAEDSAVSRHMLQKTLERWGHTVTAACDGAQAWDLFQAGNFPVVISDWMMPGIDGPELVRRIRSLETAGYAYVILLTAKSEKEDIVAGMEAGADDFVVKPFDKHELRARLRAGERIIQLEQNLERRNADLETANLRITAANERMKRDLLAAAQIQQALLPQTLPATPDFDFAWAFQPCDELAGDILNVFRLDEDHIALYVLDVSNHGIPAALLSVTISRLLSPLMSGPSILKEPSPNPPGYALAPPARIASQLNAQFPMRSQTGQYFTLIYGMLDLRTRELSYVSAGHPGPAYLSGDALTAEILEGSGMPVGFMEDAVYQEYRLPLKRGDRLYLYSDGIPEARNQAGEQFGEERMLKHLDAARHLPLEASLSSLLDAIGRWSGRENSADDISLLALEAK
jgi:sigma-B regulation protein RsbU (phosphoserine phosphatase)